jgi:hypothetical protein
MAELFDLQGLEAVVAIPWGSWVEAQGRVNGIRAGQQRADQVGGALEDAVIPAVCVHRLLVRSGGRWLAKRVPLAGVGAAARERPGEDGASLVAGG